MATYINPYVFENGLTAFTSVSITMVYCQGSPTDRTDASTLLSSGGKRVTDEIALASGDVNINNTPQADDRSMDIASQTGLGAESVDESTADLYLVIYDATRILVSTDVIANTGVAVDNEFDVQPFQLTLEQPTG